MFLLYQIKKLSWTIILEKLKAMDDSQGYNRNRLFAKP